MSASFVFLIGFLLGAFLTSFSSLVFKKTTNKPRKRVGRIGTGISVYDRFYSSVSDRFMENNIN